MTLEPLRRFIHRGPPSLPNTEVLAGCNEVELDQAACELCQLASSQAETRSPRLRALDIGLP